MISWNEEELIEVKVSYHIRLFLVYHIRNVRWCHRNFRWQIIQPFDCRLNVLPNIEMETMNLNQYSLPRRTIEDKIDRISKEIPNTNFSQCTWPLTFECVGVRIQLQFTFGKTPIIFFILHQKDLDYDMSKCSSRNCLLLYSVCWLKQSQMLLVGFVDKYW